MDLPRVYADFNGLEYLDASRSQLALHLTGGGTIASLSRLGIRLREGMQLLFCEPEDIEAVGIVYFDRSRTDPAGRTGEWMARIVSDIVDSSAPCDSTFQWPCFGCGVDLWPHLSVVGHTYRESCPACGVSTMAPLAPPS